MTANDTHGSARAAVSRVFLADIIAAPEDDAPRLIFADWLSENGEEERGEFVRVQCRIAAVEAELQSDEDCDNPGCPACVELRPLRRREGELLRREWFAPLTPCLNPNHRAPADAMPAVIRRGFASSLTCAADAFLHYADDLLAVQPVREVRLTTWPILGEAQRTDEGAYLWLLDYRRSLAMWCKIPALASEVVKNLLSDNFPGITFTLPPYGSPPEPPRNLTATAAGRSGFVLNWRRNDGTDPLL